MTLFNKIKNDKKPEKHRQRTVFIGGKAQPGDQEGKEIVRLVSAIARTINSDPTVGSQLKLVVLENYGVTLAEEIIPCADLSQVKAGLELFSSYFFKQKSTFL